MGEALSVYWIASRETDGRALYDVCERLGVPLKRLERGSMASELTAAGVMGGVVVLVDTDDDASRALGLGADEVLRTSDFGEVELDAALERAQLRASARALRDQRARGPARDNGLLLLGSALGEQILGPLRVASAECMQFTHTLRVLLSINDDLVGWARLSAPTDELRRLAARRLAAPSSVEVQEALSRMQSALNDAGELAGILRRLVADSGDDGLLPADRLAEDFAKLIAPQVASMCTIEVGDANACTIPVRASFFLSVAALLVSNALSAFEACEKHRGRILLWTGEADGLAVLSFEDDAGEMTADLRGAAAEAGERTIAGLDSLRERLTRCGGDLLVQSDPTGTQVRVVFAPADDCRLAEDAFDDIDSVWPSRVAMN